MSRSWIRTALVLFLFASIFLTFTVGSYRLESGTMDEPQHIVAGYTALKLHDYRIDPEHPPFLRMWAALPLLAMPEIKLDEQSEAWQKGAQWIFCHNFLYKDNDADRLLFRARFMIALLGVLLGVLVFCWARELFGFWPAAIVLALYATEPNLMAHSGLVTTDLGATCFIFGAIYFAWRLSRNFHAGNLFGLAAFFTLAHVSKYSAVLLSPIVVALLLARSFNTAPWPSRIGSSGSLATRGRRALCSTLTVVGLLLLAYGALWAVYGFRYAPTPSGVERFVATGTTRSAFPTAIRLVHWLEEQSVLPNANVQGFARMAARAQQRTAYLMGESREKAWWYYFPIAFLIKTPLALLALGIVGAALWLARWKKTWPDALFVLLPPAAYFGTAMMTGLNIGLRHVLIVYPFLLLLAGRTIAALWPASMAGIRNLWRGLILAGLCLVQFAEFAAVYPHCLAFFNASIGGPRHGADYLVDSNLDWGQGLKLLKRWMTENQVQHINLAYFGNADPRYYGIDYTPLTGGPFFDLDYMTAPRLPGYVAVSATNLRGAYLGKLKEFYAPLLQREPVAVIGYSIYVYWVDQQ
jgi:4-amino-4-deoxy-L-arabinose transferase-like glycosyltransferase